MFKKRLISTLWILLGIAAIGLLFIGGKKKGEKLCKGINVEVSENTKQVFVDEQGIKIEIGENGGREGVPLNQINLRDIEMQLKKDPWIRDAKLYFDGNQILQIDLKENDPIARIFTVNGNSFFIDSGVNYLPTNRNVIARVPVFTGFPSDKQKRSSPDSALLRDVKTFAQYIISDSIWMAFISQINILPDATFQIVPIVGNSLITIGSVEDISQKFDRLYSFYHQVLSKTGINKYKNINVQYSGQVIASNDSISTKTIDTTAAKINIIKMPPKAATEKPNQSKAKTQSSPLQHKQKKIAPIRKKLSHNTTTKKP